VGRLNIVGATGHSIAEIGEEPLNQRFCEVRSKCENKLDQTESHQPIEKFSSAKNHHPF
jgi:hypothetical protein